MGVTPLALLLACACAVVNFGLIDAFARHEAEEALREAPRQPRPRRRRRQRLADLASANAPPSA